MTTQSAIIMRLSQPKVEADIDSICGALDLGEPQRDRLVRAVNGHGGGNPNTPVYRMVHALARGSISRSFIFVGEKVVFLGDAKHIPLPDRALLHFFLEMDNFTHGFEVSRICESLNPDCGKDAIRAATQSLVRILQSYRGRFLHAERHRKKFNVIRKFLNSDDRAVPMDGDAMLFWSKGSTDGRWRYYSTTVGAFIDYYHDQQERAVATGILYADNETDAASDASIEPADDLSKKLTGALSSVQESPLKIFMDSEADRVQRLIRLGYLGASWPITSLTVTGYAPVQARVVQALRDKGELSEADVDHHLSLTPESQATLEEIRKLSDLCQEAVNIVYKAGQALGKIETPPEKPKLARLRQLSRRDSFRGRTEEELYFLLIEIIEPLLDIQAFLAKVIGRWETSVTKKSERLMAERALFNQGIRQIYLSGDTMND